MLSERNGVPERSSRKRADAKAVTVERPHVASSPMWCGSSAISRVGVPVVARRWMAGPAATVA